MTPRKLLPLLACLLLTGCHLQYAQSGTTQAWIDAPLDGSNLPLAPYEIIFHAGAAGNPAAVELTINEQPVALDSTNLGQPLVTVRYPWDPQEPGQYTITARTQDAAGKWSPPDMHVVTIGGPTITVSPIITVTVSPTITPTASPTPTLTPTAKPLPAAQATVTFIGASTDHFYVADKTCGPMSVTLEAQASDSLQVPHMVLFFKLWDKDTEKYTEWQSADMQSAGNGKFTFTLKGSALSGMTGRENWLIYQFIGTGADNKPGPRTQVYGDITLSVCGRYVVVPPG